LYLLNSNREEILISDSEQDNILWYPVFWSPDSRYIAYILPDTNDLYLFDSYTSNTILLANNAIWSKPRIDDGRIWGNRIIWMPDSTQILYLALSEIPALPDYWTIRSINLSDGQNEIILSGIRGLISN